MYTLHLFQALDEKTDQKEDEEGEAGEGENEEEEVEYDEEEQEEVHKTYKYLMSFGLLYQGGGVKQRGIQIWDIIWPQDCLGYGMNNPLWLLDWGLAILIIPYFYNDDNDTFMMLMTML